jgi:TonB family protein
VIFLPESVAAWSPEAIEPVIAHEMAHIRRWDELWTILANLVLALYFFNPIAWLAVRRLGQTREQLGDELVLASGKISPREYGRSLVEVLRINVFGPGATLFEGVGLIAGKERVEMRLSTILSGACSSRSRSIVGVLITIGLALFLLPMSAVESKADSTTNEPPNGVAYFEDGRPIYSFEAGGSLTEPQVIVKHPTDFTAEAIQANIQGKVILQLVIDEQGLVFEIKVIRGLPLGLTEVAISSVQHWRFAPATLDGEPVAVEYVLTISFIRDLPDEDPSQLEIIGEYQGRYIYSYREGCPLSAPQILDTTEPEYPEEARNARIAGAVILAAVIDESGWVVEVKVLRGLPLGLTESAVDAVRQWRFTPAALDGEPVMVQQVLTLRFSPDGVEGWQS